jgi:hypothetical protein
MQLSGSEYDERPFRAIPKERAKKQGWLPPPLVPTPLQVGNADYLLPPPPKEALLPAKLCMPLPKEPEDLLLKEEELNDLPLYEGVLNDLPPAYDELNDLLTAGEVAKDLPL